VKTSGSGISCIDVCVSNHGNAAVFATPTNHIFDEGYAVCRTGATYFDYDFSASGWGAATRCLPSGTTLASADGI
jgi:hypothetical protein